MAFKRDMTVDVYMAYIHVRFDDLDLHTRSQWVVRGTHKNATMNYLDNKASNKYYICYIDRRFCMTLAVTLETFIWIDQLVF